MNTDIHILKIHKIQFFVTICARQLSKIFTLREQNHFTTKADDCRNRFMQK